METVDIKKAYHTPWANVIETKSQDVLCASPLGESTQDFTIGEHFDESDWE